ncbi:MAG: hypothetical protein MJ223_00295 [Mycoplasmoidaceae bacterium]|nr:hypothetical protein [Mycoplasmoidaceae bacterium]
MNLKKKSITSYIKESIANAIKKYEKQNKISSPLTKIENISVDKTRNPKFGDFATNVVMSLNIKGDKRAAAQQIAKLINDKVFDKVEVAGPGFLNFFLSEYVRSKLLSAINSRGDNYGQFEKKKL